MGIGHNTTWIIVNLEVEPNEALTSPEDRRQALHFKDAHAAVRWAELEEKALGRTPNWKIVRLPG
jgi:hypothetical protein